MKTCARCKSSNEAAARFCTHCGSSLQDSIAARTTQVAGQRAIAAPVGNNTTIRSAQLPARNDPSCPPVTTLRRLRELLTIVNDVSGSMSWPFTQTRTKYQASIEASQIMIRQKVTIDPLDEIGLVAFADNARIVEQLRPAGTCQAQLLAALQNLKISGGTDINEGLKAADSILQWHRQGVVRRVVLLTDGQGGDPLATAASLKARGVVIDVIGVGSDPSEVDENLLRQVASVVQGQVHYRFITDSQALKKHYTELAQKTHIG